MTSIQIIDQIVLKGSLLGYCASLWRNDETKRIQFLKECSEMCNTAMAQELWGAELVNSILKHSRREPPRRKRVANLDKKILEVIIEQRQMKGLLQKEIAVALKLSTSNYCKMESGFRPLSVAQLDIISAVLGLTIFDILFLAKKLQK